MIAGEDYVFSKQKRAFDLLIAYPATPISEMAKLAARLCIIPPEFSSTAQELKMGADDETITIDKIRTMDPDTGEVFPHRFVPLIRAYGVDEIAQVKQVRKGTMSVTGHRPMHPDDQVRFLEGASHDREGSKLVDTYRATVARARPGIISSAGIVRHGATILTPNEYLAMDIEDFKKASFARDAMLLTRYFTHAIQRKFQNGNGMIPDTSSEANPASN